MKKGVILQARDFEILARVYEHAVASFEQIKVGFFPAVNIQTASNRMNRLCEGGYLRKYRAGLVIYQGVQRQIQIVYTIAGPGIQVLKSMRPGVVLRDEPVPLNPQTLIHDLTLGDVVNILRSENPGTRIVNTKLLALEAMRGVQVPDAILIPAEGTSETAIELELTVKSERRYREIVTNYRLQSRFGKVLFIYSDAGVVNKMARAAGVEPQSEGNGLIRFSKFEFRKWDGLLQKGDHTDAEKHRAA
jgi:hypothetical protein